VNGDLMEHTKTAFHPETYRIHRQQIALFHHESETVQATPTALGNDDTPYREYRGIAVVYDALRMKRSYKRRSA
jgi:response regulator RpfG family c-di-GMP phosphodiesterase